MHRYWFDGPKAGRLECVIRDMPGYPDNINRASDGTYWMAWLGMRTPSFDLALRHPGMLCDLPGSHGALFTWLDSQLHEHGVQPWAALREGMPGGTPSSGSWSRSA